MSNKMGKNETAETAKNAKNAKNAANYKHKQRALTEFNPANTLETLTIPLAAEIGAPGQRPFSPMPAKSRVAAANTSAAASAARIPSATASALTIPSAATIRASDQPPSAASAAAAAALPIPSAIQDWKISYIQRISHLPRQVFDYFDYIKSCFHGKRSTAVEEESRDAVEKLKSVIFDMKRQQSLENKNSYELLDTTDGTYGLNSNQDVSIVYKNVNGINVSRYSYESRPRYLQTVNSKTHEAVVALVVGADFKNKIKPNPNYDPNKIMVVSVSDVNPDRLSVRGFHTDLWPYGAWLKSQINDKDEDSGIPEMFQSVKSILLMMNNENKVPQIICIGFKTTGTTPIIITNIKEDNKITYTIAKPAKNNKMTTIYIDNIGVSHETPGPVNKEEMNAEFNLNFPGASIPDDVVKKLDKYNDYVNLARDQIRHFVRRVMNISTGAEVNPKMIHLMLGLKAKMASSAAITIINGEITIQNQYVLNDLEANLDETFPHWERYSINNGFNLLQRLKGDPGSSKVNISELRGCPENFHLIRHRLDKDYGVNSVEQPIVPKDLTVFEDVTISGEYLDVLTTEVADVIASQNRDAERFDVDTTSITCRPPEPGMRAGGKRRKSRSKTRQKRNKRRNTKKRYNKKEKRRKFSQRRKTKKR